MADWCKSQRQVKLNSKSETPNSNRQTHNCKRENTTARWKAQMQMKKKNTTTLTGNHIRILSTGKGGTFTFWIWLGRSVSVTVGNMWKSTLTGNYNEEEASEARGPCFHLLFQLQMCCSSSSVLARGYSEARLKWFFFFQILWRITKSQNLTVKLECFVLLTTCLKG